MLKSMFNFSQIAFYNFHQKQLLKGFVKALKFCFIRTKHTKQKCALGLQKEWVEQTGLDSKTIKFQKQALNHCF